VAARLAGGDWLARARGAADRERGVSGEARSA
jgi:hypothetical protein